MRLSSSSAKRKVRISILEVDISKSLQVVGCKDIEIKIKNPVFDEKRIADAKVQKAYMERLHKIVLSGNTQVDSIVLMKKVHKDLGLNQEVLDTALEYVRVS
jgi:hypothetical protein